jgi:predicted RND superfamily exporter protein
MRNSGAMLFGVGIILMAQGREMGKFMIIGVISIVIGTIMFLWGWKLLQVGK